MKRGTMNAERVLRGDAEKIEGGRGSVRAKGSTRREGAAPSAPVAGGGAHGGAPSHNSASGLTSRDPWQKVKLSEVAKGIYDGPHATPPPCDTPGYYFLGIPQITPTGHIDLANPRYISEDDYAKWTRRVVPREGDVIFSYEATLNLYAIIPKDMRCCLGRRMGLVRPDIAKLDFRFLYYYFFSPEWRRTVVENTVTGATVDRLPIKTFPSFQMSLPPLPVQRRIADILSAYDDLIENNRRRIAILEETARLAYRKWFGGHNISADGAVRFRHEVTKGGRGSVRAKTTTLEDVAEVLYGKDHKKIPDGTIPIFGSGGVMRYGTTAIFDKPSVLIPRKGTIGNVMYVDEPFWTVDTMFYTRFKLPNMEKILYYQLCDYNLASMSTGAAVPSMTTAILNSLEIEVPPDDLRVKFDMAVEPMFAQKRLLKKQNAAFATARDMLLPRLMKGGAA